MRREKAVSVRMVSVYENGGEIAAKNRRIYNLLQLSLRFVFQRENFANRNYKVFSVSVQYQWIQSSLGTF